jgi:hypothetical protein
MAHGSSMLRLFLGTIVLMTLLPLAASTTDEIAPTRVIESGNEALGIVLAWLPGTQPADAYRVYGLIDGQPPTLLGEVPGSEYESVWSAGVASGFDAYGVSGVRGEVESIIQKALQTDVDELLPQPCVDLDPPNVILNCGPKLYLPPPIGPGALKAIE